MNRQEFLSNNARFKIILADTDKDLVEDLIPALANEGFVVIPCGSVNEVLGHEQEHIDALVVSADFDNANGAQVVGLVRQLPSGHDIPIIVTAENEDSSNIINVLNSGADDYIFKPFSARDIAERIRGILSSK